LRDDLLDIVIAEMDLVYGVATLFEGHVVVVTV
jgi:hypothetical protein